MAVVLSWAILACSIFTLSLGAVPFDEPLNAGLTCKESCGKQYLSQSSGTSTSNDACERGCRFYTISEFISEGSDHGNGVDGAPNALPVKVTCCNSCIEAYNETSDSTVACKFGCDAQDRSTSQDKEEEGKPSIHIMRPLMQLQSVYSSMVGAFHVVRTSIVTYFVSDDKTIVAVESEPEIMMELIPQAKEEENNESVLGLEAEPRQLAGKEGWQDPSVVRCVSRHLGVPPYLLVASAVALVLFTLYVIFAICTTATPPKAKLLSSLSIQADPLPLPIKLVRPEDLTKLSLMEEEDQQAPALPSKLKLPDMEI